jgi:hypothetical protein
MRDPPLPFGPTRHDSYDTGYFVQYSDRIKNKRMAGGGRKGKQLVVDNAESGHT